MLCRVAPSSAPASAAPLDPLGARAHRPPWSPLWSRQNEEQKKAKKIKGRCRVALLQTVELTGSSNVGPYFGRDAGLPPSLSLSSSNSPNL